MNANYLIKFTIFNCKKIFFYYKNYMKTIIFLIVLNLSAFISAQDSVSVTFKVKTENLAQDKRVYISGNHKNLGVWNPGNVPLERHDDDVWTISMKFIIGEELEYKFTLGTWLNEAINEDGTVPENNFLKVSADTVVYSVIFKWKEKTAFNSDGQITGKVDYIRDLTYPGLEPRDVIIWLPPSYDSLQTKTYPVLYMHDGQNVFDPSTSAFNVDWQLDETADSLIKAEEIKEIIIVGIYNTLNRYAEYSPNDTGYLYMEFIIEELKPMIDKNYRTKPDREYTATGGASMGGLISLMLAWEHSEIFSMAACLSPAFLYRNFNYVNKVDEYDGDKKPIKLYIDNGGIALENVIQPGIDLMLETLHNKGFEQGKDLLWFKDENAVHSESAWAERSWRFLKMFFGLE